MKQLPTFSELPWNHDFWSLLRYFRSLRLRNKERINEWLLELEKSNSLAGGSSSFPIRSELIEMLKDYLDASAGLLVEALGKLRSEGDALSFCKKKKFAVGSTRTRTRAHHQSSKSLIAAVSGIANEVCLKAGVEVDSDPQRRAVWVSEFGLHVSARNLDGAIPSLANPGAIWEIKEYWGKTKGGSKMSDAVYECHLVGLELRMFEASSGVSIEHIVFVDGKEQWGHRKSDLLRFIDLHQQGLIDHLIVGREVEDDWPDLIREIVDV